MERWKQNLKQYKYNQIELNQIE